MLQPQATANLGPETGKGTGPITSSPSVSGPASGTSNSVCITCANSAMAIVKKEKKIASYMYLMYGTYNDIVILTALHSMHKSQLQ